MSLFAPLAVPVEVRAPDRRVFRLSRSVAPTGLRLERPAPFELGRAVMARFVLPRHGQEGAPETVELRAVVALTDDDGDGEHGGSALNFLEPKGELEDAIVQYVRDRLGLPGNSLRHLP